MWDNSLVGFADDLERQIMGVAIEATTDLLTAFNRLAPVDTSLYVSHMNVGIGSRDYTFVETKMLGRSGAYASGIARIATIPRDKLTDIHITNPTPYADDLEQGSSPKAPNGVFTVGFVGVAQKYR